MLRMIKVSPILILQLFQLVYIPTPTMAEFSQAQSQLAYISYSSLISYLLRIFSAKSKVWQVRPVPPGGTLVAYLDLRIA